MMAPLDGVHVLDLSLLLPGPLCGQILRDLGAEVTKIEPPEPGDYAKLWPPHIDGVAATYFAINRGKRIISLDMKSDAGRSEFLELAAGADVVLEGFRPGVMDRLGVGFAKLSEINPRIVMCSISGYGQSGPLVSRAGHDINYQALAGVLSISGGSEASPANPPLQVADTAAGSYGGAMLILAALLERERTGRGRHVDISMSEQLLPLMSGAYATSGATGENPRRDGEMLSGGAPCYRIFRTADGRFLSLGALEPKFWDDVIKTLVRGGGDADALAAIPHLGSEQTQAHVDLLAGVIATKTRDEWVALFAEADACCEPVLEFDEVIAHPQWQARGSFVELKAVDGTRLRVPKMPASLAGFDTSEARG